MLSIDTLAAIGHVSAVAQVAQQLFNDGEPGTVDEKIDQLKERYPWLADHLVAAIKEMYSVKDHDPKKRRRMEPPTAEQLTILQKGTL